MFSWVSIILVLYDIWYILTGDVSWLHPHVIEWRWVNSYYLRHSRAISWLGTWEMSSLPSLVQIISCNVFEDEGLLIFAPAWEFLKNCGFMLIRTLCERIESNDSQIFAHFIFWNIYRDKNNYECVIEKINFENFGSWMKTISTGMNFVWIIECDIVFNLTHCFHNERIIFI